MINHLRTLLLNAPYAQHRGDDYPGEEYVPPGYNGIVLPTQLRSIHGALFGFNPDRAYLNYRLRQYLGLLRSGDLASEELRYDKRVTYDSGFNDAQLLAAPRTIYTPPEVDISFIGQPRPDDGSGRCFWEVSAIINSETSVELTRLGVPSQTESVVCSFSNELSSPISLINDLSFSFHADAIGQMLEFQILARPEIGLSRIMSAIDDLIGHEGSGLFDPINSDTMSRWKNIWKLRAEVVYRLPCVLLALAERIEERRSNV